VVIDPDGGFALQPGSFVLGNTIERIELPIVSGQTSLAARVEGRSSFARCGLIIHFTAPTIHAGFSGTITLEMTNLGSYPIMLYQDLPICQLIIEEVRGEPYPNPSTFHQQSHPTGVK
jgi:dCTP deaminase